MSDMGQCQVWIHVDNGWPPRDVGVFPFLREKHLPAEIAFSKWFQGKRMRPTGQGVDPAP